MDTHQKMLFEQLKKKYGYYIAQNKAALASLSDRDLFESLIIYDLDTKIVYSVADFANSWRSDEAEERSALIVLNNLFLKHVEQVVALAGNLDPKLAETLKDKVKKLFKE